MSNNIPTYDAEGSMADFDVSDLRCNTAERHLLAAACRVDALEEQPCSPAASPNPSQFDSGLSDGATTDDELGDFLGDDHASLVAHSLKKVFRRDMKKPLAQQLLTEATQNPHGPYAEYLQLAAGLVEVDTSTYKSSKSKVINAISALPEREQLVRCLERARKRHRDRSSRRNRRQALRQPIQAMFVNARMVELWDMDMDMEPIGRLPSLTVPMPAQMLA